MKKNILLAVVLVFSSISFIYANAYEPTLKDTVLVTQLETKIEMTGLDKLKIIDTRLAPLLSKYDKSTRIGYILQQLQDLIRDQIAELNNNDIDEVIDDLFDNDVILPDFYVKNMEVVYDDTYAGGVGLIAEYCNQGGNDIDGDAYITSVGIVTQQNSFRDTGHEHKLLAGECRTHRAPLGSFGIDSGYYTFEFHVDRLEEVTESDENNNFDSLSTNVTIN